MIRQHIEGMLARGAGLRRRLPRYDWRALALVSIAAATLNLTFAQLPMLLPSGHKLSLAPAILLLVATFCGALPALLIAPLTAVGEFLAHLSGATGWIDVNAWIYPLSAAIAGVLLRARVPAIAALLVYALINVLPLLADANLSPLWLQLASAELFASLVNFTIASALWLLLPRRSSFTCDRRRRSLEQRIFSWSLLASLVTLWLASLASHIYVMLLAAAGAAALCALLSQGTVRTTRSLAAAPAEIARLLLTWQRSRARLERRLRRSHELLAEERTKSEQLRAGTTKLVNRLKEQSQTLLQAQRRDVINVKGLEHSLQQAYATIQQIRTSRTLFIGMMSHEVRTPLHGLLSTLSLLREEKLSTEGERRLAIARNSARALMQIANDILDLSSIEAGGFSLEKGPFDPRRLVREIAEEFLATAQVQHLHLSAVVADDVPRALIGDGTRIRQVISNLVTNALKFTPAGRVTIQESWRDGRLIVDVIDTGKGVPPDQREAIFDSFVQAESAPNRRFTGTGLGLTIGRRLAQAMGGSLTLHATGSKGSTFRLEIALEISSEPAPEDESQRVLVRYAGHVLVVEDNEANQYVVKTLLEGLGCTAEIAASGAQALEMAHETQFDLVLMDCQLPGMDGFETSQRMRQSMATRIPIIAMTANALPEDKAHCLEAGMDDFLPKPFNKAELSRVLSHWLAAHGNGGADDERGAEAEPVLDPVVFEELWESLRWRTKPLEEIYVAVVNNVRGAIQLLAAFETTPTQRLLRSLHTIRGSASMVGAKRIAWIAGMLEHAAQNGQLARQTIEDAQLPKAMQELEHAVRERLSAYDSPRGG